MRGAATGLLLARGVTGVEVVDGEGRTESIRAGLGIGADGMCSSVARLTSVRPLHERLAREMSREVKAVAARHASAAGA